MKADDVATVLTRGLFHFRRWLVVPNVSWSLLPWEADLLAVSGSGYLYEIEIKVSIADLRRDLAKRKWRWHGYGFDAAASNLRGMWYAMPESVWQHKDAPAAVHEKAGVIVIEDGKRGPKARVVRPCKANKSADRLSDHTRLALARLGTMRYWTKRQARTSKEPMR